MLAKSECDIAKKNIQQKQQECNSLDEVLVVGVMLQGEHKKWMCLNACVCNTSTLW